MIENPEDGPNSNNWRTLQVDWRDLLVTDFGVEL
jgi:hypothetical protein